MYNGGYTRNNMFGLKLDYAAFLPRLVEALLHEHPGEVWLIPHTYAPADSVGSDPEACRRVRAALPDSAQGRVRVLTGKYDCQEIKGVIGQCDFFIGSRMHACIAALSRGIPTVAIAYRRRSAGVFESVGAGDWVVDGRTTEEADATARVVQLYRHRNGVRERLSREAETASALLRDCFGRLLQGPVSVNARQPS